VRVLLLNQFYPPDVAPTGQFLSDLAVELVARGHEVHVACSRRSYGGAEVFAREEERDGVLVHRLPGPGYGRGSPAGRVAGYGAFLGRLAVAALWRLPRPDLVVALTTPPFLGLLGRAAARARRARHAHWVMDVYPGALAAHGMLRAGGPAFGLLRALARWQHRGAAFVLAPGPCVARRLQEYTGDLVPTWVPLWGDGPPCPGAEATECRRSRGWADQELVLMYSGNMGLGHRFEEFLQAAARLGPGGPLWAFAGGGARREEVEAFARARPEARIRMLPYVPRSELPASLGAADVHLVSLSRAWQGLIVPSKVQGIFSAARPALFVGPDDNEVARWIRESGGGWVVGEDDVSGLLSAVEAARDPGERLRRGQAALDFARERFDRRRNLETVSRLVEQAAGA